MRPYNYLPDPAGPRDDDRRARRGVAGRREPEPAWSTCRRPRRRWWRSTRRCARSRGADQILVDMHAEVTSEKVALGWYLDGKVTAVVGTHTHVPTADLRVLPGGTAYITDVGMTGARGGVIGMKKEQSIAVMRTHMPMRYEPSEVDPWLNAVLIQATRRAAPTRSSRSCARSLTEHGRRHRTALDDPRHHGRADASNGRGGPRPAASRAWGRSIGSSTRTTSR